MQESSATFAGIQASPNIKEDEKEPSSSSKFSNQKMMLNERTPEESKMRLSPSLQDKDEDVCSSGEI